MLAQAIERILSSKDEARLRPSQELVAGSLRRRRLGHRVGDRRLGRRAQPAHQAAAEIGDNEKTALAGERRQLDDGNLAGEPDLRNRFGVP